VERSAETTGDDPDGGRCWGAWDAVMVGLLERAGGLPTAGVLTAVDARDLAGHEGRLLEIEGRLDNIAALAHAADRGQSSDPAGLPPPEGMLAVGCAHAIAARRPSPETVLVHDPLDACG
jgi:hypothetical protein